MEATFEEQVEALRAKRWDRNLLRPIAGTLTAEKWASDYPVWLGADKGLSASPLPHPGRIQVSGHVRVAVPEVTPTTTAEPKVEKKPRSPKKTGPKLYGEGSNYPIAEQLRQVIRASGLKQQEVADKTGIDFTVVYRFMKCDRDISMRSLQQMIKVFGGEIKYTNPKGDG